MICNNCGANIGDGSSFCTHCGAPVQAQRQNVCGNCGAALGNDQSFCSACGAPVQNTQAPCCRACGAPLMAGHPVCVRCGAPVSQPVMNAYSEQQASSVASSALTFGILGVIFSCTFILSLLGIIFSCIAMSKAKKYKEMTGTYLGKAGVGRGLGIGGLISGIFMILILFFYIALFLMIPW